MKKRLQWFVLMFAVMMTTQACEAFAPVCTTVAVPALAVTVVDSLTGEPVTGEGVRVIATDGDFVESTGVWSNGSAGLAHERSGTYRVEVEAPGYDTWMRERVNVRSDECHVRTVELEARLQSTDAAT